MDRQRLLKFIQESKQHLKEASTEQKIKILRLIKEAHTKLLETGNQDDQYKEIVLEDSLSNKVDYLEEK